MHCRVTMNSSLIVASVVVVLIVLLVFILILKKKSADKALPAHPAEEDSQPEPQASAEPEEVIIETVEPESISEIDIVPEPENSQLDEFVDTLGDESANAVESMTVSESELGFPSADEEVQVGFEETVVLSRELYEQRLFALKEEKLAELTRAVDDNNEEKREECQVELVVITEALTFVDRGYEQELSCRKEALSVLDQLQTDVNPAEYNRARTCVVTGNTEDAEQVFDRVAEGESAYAAAAAYQSGRLAQCRLDFKKAMQRFERAVALDPANIAALRAAGLLARRLYEHNKAIRWFTSLVGLLEEQGEDTVELALARRDLAYTFALLSQYKKAGVLYKKAMVSLSRLLGRDDPEMGACWYQIGNLQEALGRYEKAEEPYKKALAIMDKAGNGNTPELGDILDKLAALYMELEREREAIPLFERLCTFKEQSPNPDKVTLIMACNNLAEAYRISGMYRESEEKYRKSLLFTEELYGKDHAAVGSIMEELTQVCQRQGKMEEANNCRQRATAIFEHVIEEQEAAGQELESLTLSD